MNSRKVLIADDEPSIVTSLEYLMLRNGYEVKIARDGDEVLAQVESFRPDVVLLDVMMPRRNGYEVCQKIRERPDWGHIRIVMLSAKGSESEVTKGLALGADVYVTKPFSNQKLIATIEGLLVGEWKPPGE